MSLLDADDSNSPQVTHFGRPGHGLCEGQETILQGRNPVTGFTTHRGFVSCPDCLRILAGRGQ